MVPLLHQIIYKKTITSLQDILQYFNFQGKNVTEVERKIS